MQDPVAAQTALACSIGFDRALHANCGDILWQNLTRNPDKTALVGPHGTWRYGELIAEAGRWGTAFAAAGLVRDDRIAFFLDDTPALAAAFFGAVRAGFVPVLLNIQTRPDLLRYYLEDSGAQVAVVEADLSAVFEAGCRDTRLSRVICVNGEAAPFESADTFLAGHSATCPKADTRPDDMAFWMYSSGSTGRPKGIVHLHHDMAYTQAAFGAHVLQLRSDDICFSVPKIYFAYGFGNAFTFPFSIGATTLLMPGQPDAQTVLDLIERHRATVFFGLPTLYTALARANGVEHRDLSSIRQSMSAAEILSEDIYEAWKALVGHGPTEGLGSTEMLHIYLSNTLSDHRHGAAGAVVPGYEVKLLTPDGKAVAPGEHGVMHVRGDSSAPCYWQRPDKTRATMRGDWINTGDRFLERDGYYYFQGRDDDLVKVAGQWVWPMEVERCLNEHADVHEAAVLAVELPDRRMALKAVVSLTREADTAELRDFVKARLTPYKSPRLFEVIDDLPKTGTGKIDRQLLIDIYGGADEPAF
ncbi:MAG: benzoate-CoA ligase family protein [Pseudomonadota bacterium]